MSVTGGLNKGCVYDTEQRSMRLARSNEQATNTILNGMTLIRRMLELDGS